MMSRTPIDLVAIRSRHPQHFGPPSRERRLLQALGAGALLLLLVGMAQLGFFSGAFLSGIGKLCEVVGLMLPPNPGDWAHVRLYSMSLVETVAISFLGTLGASLLAVPVALLSYGLWERRYGKDPAVIGRSVRLNDVATTIIGVMPSGFTFPGTSDLWTPYVPGADSEKREARRLIVAFAETISLDTGGRGWHSTL